MAQTLDANLNVIQETPIELELINGDLNIISKLDDEPNDVGGLTSTELKAKFDEAGNIIKTYLNESLVPAVLAADATEATRSAAEAERVANEQERVANENARVPAEETRVANESTRQEREVTRKSNELARIAAEQERAANEEQRIINENTREDLETGYVARAEAAATRAEKAAADAENTVGGDYVTQDELEAAIGSIPTESDVFIAEYGVTTNAEIEAARTAGKTVFCVRNVGTSSAFYAPLISMSGSGTNHRFLASGVYSDDIGANIMGIAMQCVNDEWSVETKPMPYKHASIHAADGADPITLDSLTIESSGGKVFKLSVSDSGAITAVQV